MTIALPVAVDQPPLIIAGAIWSGILVGAGSWAGWLGLGVTTVVAVCDSRRLVLWLAAAACLAGLGSQALVDQRHSELETALPAGRTRAVVEAITDTVDGRFEAVAVVRPLTVIEGALPNSPIAVSGWQHPVQVGDRFEVVGGFRPGVVRIGARTVAGRIDLFSSRVIGGRPGVHIVVANALRNRVLRAIEPDRSEPRALLAGFLIGDTTELSEASTDAMRRAGLSHFVAVSGSNVALFLAMWWIVLGPIGLRRWARTAAGLFGLAVFAAMTRWEPSVIRAAGAAATLLVSRSVGIPLSTWSTLGVAVSVTLLVAGELATNVGFQLSTLAVIGVLSGSNLIQFRPRSVALALSASLAAQAMVSPVLVATFGSLPVLSPLANVIAGPLVLAATTLSGIGVVLGLAPLIEPASWFASAVLASARVAAPWPQVDGVGLMALCLLLMLVLAAPRRLSVPVVGLAVSIAIWPSSIRPDELPAAVFLNIGQGDSTLLLDEEFTVLIDGGPDPAVLQRKLDAYDVRSIDVLIITHVHADHIMGLEAVVGRMPVGVIVADFEHHATPASAWLLAESERIGVPIVSPDVGSRFGSEDLDVEMLAPLRRYASPNDESVVVLATMAGTRILMSGDIERVAQSELSVAGVDVLKVPHQGAATSDPNWLMRHAGSIAVVSVGPNSFGHPSDTVIEVLEAAGSLVHRTDVDGDLVFDQSTRLRRR